MTSMRDAFREGLIRAMPDEMVEWRGRADIERDVEERLDRELARCDDMEFARQFAEGVPVEGCEPEDYLQRVVEIDEVQHVLAGIRFHGTRGFPFVDLLASTAPIADESAMRRVLESLLEAYSGFEPHIVRVMWPQSRPLPLPKNYERKVDQHLHAGAIVELAARSIPSRAERVTLEEVEAVDEAAAFVADAYDEFLGEHPDLEGVVGPEEADTLETCRETGELTYIRVDGERAGLLATRDELGPLVRGQCVVEEILTKPYRGRRLAPAAQRRLVERLADSHSDAVLWGTIDRRNAASRATAERIGRHSVAAWHWLIRP